MKVHRKTTAALAVAAMVAGGQLAWAGAQAAPAANDDGAALLRADASGALRLERDARGVVDFVGTSGAGVVNPGVSGSESLRDAARAHLDRYGSALGLAGTAGLTATSATPTPSGQDAVRFQQSVDGAPVIGGQVVVSLRPDHQLGSMLATLTRSKSLPSATVAEGVARKTAAQAAARSADRTGLTTVPQGRAVWDPSVFGERGSAQGVWSFEVGDGQGVRRLVLVDDTSGRVVLDLDQVEHLDRVVCDATNVATAAVPCTSGFARTEASGPSGVPDVNFAFDHAGEVATAYQEIAGLDLTQAIGIDVGGVKKLASTVRYCEPGYTCNVPPSDPDYDPYENAFWNGSQMYYGNGFANADDVVGHEMTHGVIDQYSELFYWGQSGAMNESIADIMGEIIDHRATLGAEDANWRLAEDLSIGAIRDMKNPPAFNDPDRMTSPLWYADTSTYGDGGGVHYNSGVGNKTAYLISQGGTFNGQTIVGIDGSDTGLTKTGKLYFDAITRLTSGSDYANLAAVLEQSCADFAARGTAGFTTADCDNVKKAVLATELRTTPTNAPQPADAVQACPAGTTLRELFNSETGDPATKLTSSAPGMWGYGVNADWDTNATSGKTSWFGYDPDPSIGDPDAASLTATSPISLPAGQKSFMSFQQWRLFEWTPAGNGSPARYYDGGTVEINGADAAGLPWTNGPQQALAPGTPSFPNNWGGRTAFAGDSFGWTNSQVDLSQYAGTAVAPSFTARGDSAIGYIGWFLDDISVYTCDVPPVVTPPTPPTPPASKAVSRTTVKVSTKAGKVTITAKVSAKGGRATGKVAFKVTGKKKVSSTVRVKKGKAVLVLKGTVLDKLGAGKHTVKATYKGSDTVARSKARASFNLR